MPKLTLFTQKVTICSRINAYGGANGVGFKSGVQEAFAILVEEWRFTIDILAKYGDYSTNGTFIKYLNGYQFFMRTKGTNFAYAHQPPPHNFYNTGRKRKESSVQNKIRTY